MTNFFEKLLNLLRQDERFFSTDGKLLRNKVYEAAMQTDEELLKILLGDEDCIKNFFKDVAGVKVFDKIKFGWAINNRQFLPDSYTHFKNKIGLADSNENFISTSNDVALFFPYKDCLLAGGQTKDDQKRDEIFFNAILARSEVDRLLDPKVLVNAKKFSADGITPAENFSDSDNLIVKGNNLLVISSLAEKFENKIKCIYIDVPYNTGNDSFGYNDKFRHSTWLTFMKNRLEILKKLLANDGSIWISIDDDEQAYLKVLCDEIFKRDNFVCNVIWEKKYSPQNDAKWLSDSHDFILVYAKNKKSWRPNLLPRTEKQNHLYKYDSNDGKGLWRSDNLSVKSYSANYDYPIQNPLTKVFYNPPEGRCWMTNQETVKKWIEEGRIFFGQKGDGAPQLKRYLSEVQGGTVSKTIWKQDEVGHNDEAKKEIKALNLAEIFSTPKPERLIERILTLATNEGDLVLDNFMGSGTTAAVAHKMGRRYIGVEQMDYIETVAVERLKKVIDGEQGGISKNVDWQGGGSFIYCELAKLNQNFVEEIFAAEDFLTLKKIYEKIIEKGFISQKILPADIDKNFSEFEELSLENQKKFLVEILDKNLLYVNFRDIDDAEFKISDADKKFSRSFYG